jgi:hypothetical protein
MEQRRRYSVRLVVNDRQISEVIIDSHYERKHRESVNDEIILELVRKLDGRMFDPDDEDDEYQYFKTEPIEYSGKNYRLNEEEQWQ